MRAAKGDPDMMGMVFTEFVEFVEGRHGPDMFDDLLDQCDLPSGGAYTTVAVYDHAELVHLVTALASATRVGPADVLKRFGEHLAVRFATLFPDFFSANANLFDFLASVERKIHIEVRKLYPEARPPSISASRRAPDLLLVDYRSCRNMEALAEGLIRGAARHFGETVEIQSEILPGGDRTVRFRVRSVR